MSEAHHGRDLADIPTSELPRPSYAPCANSTTTHVKTSAGLLHALWIAGTGTAGTVAVKDGTATVFTAGVPAAVGTWSLPLPPQGVRHDTLIDITCAGSGVTAC